MDTRKIPVFCYWNGCIKDGPDGPFYEGSSPRVIRVESKIELSKLLDDLHRVTGLEKGKFQIDLIGRYPSIVQPSMVKYMRLPVVDDCSLETMLELPSYHPSINNVEFYLQVIPVSEPLSHPLTVANSVSSSANQAARKRFRTDDANVNVSVRENTLRTPRELNSNGWIEDEQSTDAGNCGSGGGNSEAVPKNANLENSGPTNVLSNSVSKQLFFSSSWLDERELQVGMLFSDKDELDKAVKLYSCRRHRGYFTRECSYSIDFRRSYGCYKCGWTLTSEKTKGNFFEITKYRGPHTCEPEDVGSDFLACEIECLIRAQPLLSVAELNKWVKEGFGYTVSGDKMLDAKKKATIAISGDLEKSFSVLPKFMAALCSSNKIVLDCQYDILPDSEDASFRSVFWAFQLSIEGFPLCRPLVIVDTIDLSGKYPGKMLVAAGLDADNSLFPLAFAIITQESLSADTWRWFFGCIRKKVTQREGLCLITSLYPDIVTVVNEPECQWMRHRFCLRHMCFKFYEVFSNNLMTEFVYKAGSTSYSSTFNYYLKKIEEMNPEARKWLDEIPPHQWALSHDSDGLRFGIMDTNLIFTTYGFVNKDRDLPITTCMLLIFDHLAELFKSRLGESLNREELYAKHVMKKLEEYKVAGRTLDVLPLEQTGESFKVTEVLKGGNKRFFVHRSDRVCTCGIWQLYKYPCPHLLAVCRKMNIDHLQYVNDFYNIESSLGVYAANFNPLPGVSDWPEVIDAPRLFPPGSRKIH
ncbi:hypothetical protein V5N11_013578 [Cardamine amara subsp. amara]|uniref:SWIM-type domain-containing protein n=1 Tax=Cardamine amara subsp. amara TaxID=228776 RepID=A0ABD0ZLR9_CARAN